MNHITIVALLLILAKWAAELGLAWLNRREVRAHAAVIPEAFQGLLDTATYAKSVQYTLVKNRFGQFETALDTVVLLAALFSGLLPWGWDQGRQLAGPSVWTQAAFLFLTGLVLSLPGWPMDWHAQFRLEERFGFNRMTPRLWWADRFKGLLLGLALGYPLLVLVLKLVDWTGANWWLWAWVAVMSFQVLMLVLAPILILPLFNQLTPLPEGPLRERLTELSQRTGFRTAGIQVMDGSKRSQHSNAFFTGFGRFRKIVLFDTLIQQLTDLELAAVLAHEIGHYRLKHLPKRLLASAAGLGIGFYVLNWLAQQDWFYRAFGFQPGPLAPALLLFGLLGGVVTFWLSPLFNLWSRRHEYAADACAAKAMGGPEALITGLRKLNEKNLSNLTPHPIYSGFFYSHPTLLERELALKGHPVKTAAL